MKQAVRGVRLWSGGIAALLAVAFGSAAAWAAPVDDAEKTDVTIPAGDALLAATLYRPKGAKGDIPAVVVGHGSGPVTRKNTFWTNAALSTGLAALVYDKRGRAPQRAPIWTGIPTRRRSCSRRWRAT